jgi:hypothetical protein
MFAMTEKQRKFREAYRARISPYYHGLVHIAVMYAAGIGALWYCVGKLENPGWEWLVIAPVALAGNLIEWGMHKFVMHRRIDVFALRAIYERHTREHHQYFTDNEPTINTIREFRIVFFPWRVLIVLAVSGSLFGWLASLVWNANAGYILFMTMIGHYMVYESFHFCCHVPENSVVQKLPLVNTIRRHHTAHHNQGIMMHRNMNLTFPVADWLMGTSDLNRGLLGHLFNGYSQAHIKPELIPVINKFRQASVQENRVSLDGPTLTEEEQRAVVTG